MQTPPSPPSTLAWYLLALATPLASGLSVLFTYLFTRPKQSADIHESRARTLKTEAESRQIDSDIIQKAYQRLEQLEEIVRNMGVSKLTDESRIRALEWEAALSKQREELLNQQIRLAHAELETLRQPRTG